MDVIISKHTEGGGMTFAPWIQTIGYQQSERRWDWIFSCAASRDGQRHPAQRRMESEIHHPRRRRGALQDRNRARHQRWHPDSSEGIWLHTHYSPWPSDYSKDLCIVCAASLQPLDFEEAPRRELFISVQNPLPYLSSCKVVEKTSSGLWTVDTSKGDDPSEGQPHTMKVIIEVEDINDAPTFDVSVKEAVLEENAPVGTWVEKVTAVDPDSAPAQDFVWVTDLLSHVGGPTRDMTRWHTCRQQLPGRTGSCRVGDGGSQHWWHHDNRDAWQGVSSRQWWCLHRLTARSGWW